MIDVKNATGSLIYKRTNFSIIKTMRDHIEPNKTKIVLDQANATLDLTLWFSTTRAIFIEVGRVVREEV